MSGLPPKTDPAPHHGMLHECHERTSEMVRPGSMNELGTSSAEIIHRLHFVSTELADEAYAPRSARHWRVQRSFPFETPPDRDAFGQKTAHPAKVHAPSKRAESKHHVQHNAGSTCCPTWQWCAAPSEAGTDIRE